MTPKPNMHRHQLKTVHREPDSLRSLFPSTLRGKCTLREAGCYAKLHWYALARAIWHTAAARFSAECCELPRHTRPAPKAIQGGQVLTSLQQTSGQVIRTAAGSPVGTVHQVASSTGYKQGQAYAAEAGCSAMLFADSDSELRDLSKIVAVRKKEQTGRFAGF